VLLGMIEPCFRNTGSFDRVASSSRSHGTLPLDHSIQSPAGSQRFGCQPGLCTNRMDYGRDQHVLAKQIFVFRCIGFRASGSRSREDARSDPVSKVAALRVQYGCIDTELEASAHEISP